MDSITIIFYVIILFLAAGLSTLLVLSSFTIRNAINLGETDEVWCHNDWMCGLQGGQAETEVISPVIDSLPQRFACRLENFTTQTIDDPDNPGTPLTYSCVCPVQVIIDKEVGPGYKIVNKETNDIDIEFAICDNYRVG
ncbi:MAG: hypothetical protein WBA74_26035, partial [Cyclobacteriaceae bacterium]